MSFDKSHRFSLGYLTVYITSYKYGFLLLGIVLFAYFRLHFKNVMLV